MVKENGVSVSMLKTAICTRATMWTIKRTEWVYSFGSRVTTTKGATRMTSAMDTERCTGRMGPATRENGPMEFKME